MVNTGLEEPDLVEKLDLVDKTTTPAQKSENVLAIWSERNSNGVSSALITDFNGNVKQISWSAGSDTTAYCVCSVLFKDKIYFIGEV